MYKQPLAPTSNLTSFCFGLTQTQEHVKKICLVLGKVLRCLRGKIVADNVCTAVILTQRETPEDGSSLMEIASCSRCAASSSNTQASDEFSF